MEGQTILLIRHGDVDLPVIHNVPVIYDPNTPLSDRGIHQGIQLAKRLNNINIQPDIIHTSTYKRAYQTAKTLHDTFPNHPPVVPNDQISGTRAPQWDNRPATELGLVDNDFFADNPCLPEIHGETLPQTYARTIAAYKRLLNTRPKGVIAMVTHGEIIGMIAHYLSVGDLGSPGVGKQIEKGEALLLRVSPEGTLIETRIISPEGWAPRVEMRG